jgi:putative oxidoreductase
MSNSSQSMSASLSNRLDSWFTPLAQIVTRVAFGQAFAITGWGKLHNLEGLTKFFTDLGIPAANIQAPFIATLEFVGGLCLVLGLATRPMALLLSCTMVVALVTAHGEDLAKVVTLDESFANVAPIPFLVAMLWLIAKGAGKLSVDHLIAKRSARG